MVWQTRTAHLRAEPHSWLVDSSPLRIVWYREVNRDASTNAKLRELAALQKIDRLRAS